MNLLSVWFPILFEEEIYTNVQFSFERDKPEDFK